MGLYWDNEKENGIYCLGFKSLGFIIFLWASNFEGGLLVNHVCGWIKLRRPVAGILIAWVLAFWHPVRIIFRNLSPTFNDTFLEPKGLANYPPTSLMSFEHACGIAARHSGTAEHVAPIVTSKTNMFFVTATPDGAHGFYIG